MSGIVGSSHNIRGSGIVAKLGTDGQVFTSAGAGVKQTFEDAAGGGAWNFLSKQTASDDDLLEWNSDITSTYDVYKLFCSNALCDTDQVQVYIQLRQSDSYLTSSYRWGTGRVRDDGAVYAHGSTSSSFIRITDDFTGTGTGETWNFEITFWDLLGTANYSQIHWNGTTINQDARLHSEMGAGAIDDVGAMDGFKIYPSSGNIASGEFSLFGLSQS